MGRLEMVSLQRLDNSNHEYQVPGVSYLSSKPSQYKILQMESLNEFLSYITMRLNEQ